MVNWSDPNVISLLSTVLNQLNYILLGVYLWEYVQSWHIELALIRRRMRLRWPLLPYIAGRIFLLMALVLICWLSSPISQNANCRAGFLVFTLAANGTIGCSSLNLMLRPFMLWKTWRFIRVFLVLATIGQWIFLLRMTFAFSVMNVNGSCGWMVVDHFDMTSLFVYTMCYDLLALALTIIGLRNTPSSNKIRRMLQIQGITYVVVTCVANIIPTVISLLNLNAVMNVAFALPASAISTIASSRIVVSLLDPEPSNPVEEMSSGDAPLTTMLAMPITSSIDVHHLG